uniref:Uncharacterized protein n=1 Tax=Caenorhabditis tropicalis TaxID=1561998 RepID=A0A1I7TDV7_9PELO
MSNEHEDFEPIDGVDDIQIPQSSTIDHLLKSVLLIINRSDISIEICISRKQSIRKEELIQINLFIFPMSGLNG